jgi:autotransporter family porin
MPISFKLKRIAYAINCVCILGSVCLAGEAQSAVTYYEANSSNSERLSIGLAQNHLNKETLNEPDKLELGGNMFAYATVMFTATEDGVYSFGQTYSPLDTVMILYNDIFDPTAPGSGAIIGNDDVGEDAHWNALGSQETISCGFKSNRCPQITYSVKAGQTYTLFVSHVGPYQNINEFEFPFTFYSTGSVVFGSSTGRSPINMMRSFYKASELGVSVDPSFVGGTLRMDQINGIYGDDFTLSSMASNTIDQYGNHSVFTGNLSDAVSGSSGHIVIDDSSGTNLGSVTFAGDNTYTGSTTVKGGVLIVSKDANLGASSASLVLDGGKLMTTGTFTTDRDVTIASDSAIDVYANTALTLSGQISGNGSLSKDGGGVLILAADNRYSGTTSVHGGALIVGGSAQPNVTLTGNGDITVANGASLGGYGTVAGDVVNHGVIGIGSAINTGVRSASLASFTVNGNMVNNNTIVLGSRAAAGDVLKINGDYVGNNATLILHTVLGGDNSTTDRLIISGDASGSTGVTIYNLGGAGAPVIEGIEIIKVGGVSSNDAFIQNGRIVAGAYEYQLVKGNVSGSNTESWFLRSNQTLRPEVGAYVGLVEFNQGTFNHSFHDRQQGAENGYQSTWARLEYTQSKSKAGQDGQLTNKADRTLLHIGADVFENEALHLGLMGGYSKGDINSDSSISGYKTSAKSDGYSVGAYATWFDQSVSEGGLYLDSYLQYNWFNNKVNGQGINSEKFNSSGVTGSAEVGYGFLIGQVGETYWLLEPQAQIIYNSYSSGDRVETNGTRIRMIRTDDFVSRVGLRLQGTNQTVKPFVTLNYWHHSNQPVVRMDEVRIESLRARNMFEVKMGGEIALIDNVRLYGQLQNSFGKDSSQNYGGNIGIKAIW